MSRKFGDMVAIGRIVKPQGRHGEVVAESFSDVPERFPSLRTAYVPGPDGSARAVQVTSSRPHKHRFVLKIAGVDSIDDAELYRGLELRIGEEELQALPEGSYYHHQLRGLRVEDQRGRPLGEVTEVLMPGATPVLVVQGGEGEIMIPLADAFVHEVDLPHGRMVATRPEMTVAER
jgi:16S rRNA processing protein RimM